MNEQQFLLGIDGGRTKTVVVIEYPDSKEKIQFTAGALNVNGQRQEDLECTVSELVQKLKGYHCRPQDCAGLGIGMAGISNENSKEILQSLLTRAGFRTEPEFYGDQQTAYAAAFGAAPGIVLIAGTGSICFGRDAAGDMVRSGGYGHMFDDKGSAYDIGRQMIEAILQAADHRRGPTLLTGIVFDVLAVDSVEELITYLYAPERKKSEIAALARHIETATEQQDKAAIQIETAAAASLAEMIFAVDSQLAGIKETALRGSVLLRNDRIYELLSQKIKQQRPEVQLYRSDTEAAEGTLFLLKEDRKR